MNDRHLKYASYLLATASMLPFQAVHSADTPIATPSCSEAVGSDIALAAPSASQATLDDSILARRSTRDFSNQAISVEHLSKILLAAQGITDIPSGKRAAPSAGSTYPITIYFFANRVDGLEQGIYRYDPKCHQVSQVIPGDFAQSLTTYSANQPWVGNAAAVLCIAGNPDVVARRYPKSPRNSVLLEAGHISQNIYLQATALKLGALALTGFSAPDIGRLLHIDQREEVVYLNLIGHPQTR